MLQHTNHHYHLHRLSGFPELFLAHGLRGLAEGLAAVFIPIFLINLGYSFSEVFRYLAEYGFFWMLLAYPSLKLGNLVGANRWMGLSLFGNVTLFALLITMPSHHWPLELLAFIFATSTSMYWLFFRSSFAFLLAHRKPGKVVGTGNAIQTMAAGLAPAIGGIVATLFGVEAIQIAALFLFLMAAAPLLTGKHFFPRKSTSISFRKLWRRRRELTANFAETYNDISLSYMWPLFIFVLIPSYAGVGILSSIMILSSIGVSLYVGRREESKGVKHYISEGSILNGIVHALRFGVQNASQVTGVNVLAGVGYSLYITPYCTKYYEDIRQDGLGFAFAMQWVSALSVCIAFTVLFFLSQSMEPKTSLLIALALAIPASLGIRLMNPSKKT